MGPVRFEHFGHRKRCNYLDDLLIAAAVCFDLGPLLVRYAVANGWRDGLWRRKICTSAKV